MKKSLLTLFIFFSLFTGAQNPLVKVWDYRFGGTAWDYLRSFQLTSDGGFILGGVSYSNIGGDKTQNNYGDEDYWIVKTDSNGNKLWDKDFGGTDQEQFYSIQQTLDGGYILGGYSVSNIGGSKTENICGGCDYWIIKTDSLGNKQWDKDFGGSNYDILFSIQQTSDAGFILGGASNSDSSGNKTQNTWGLRDYWIVKTDSLGDKQWDKDFGGSNYDFLHSVRQTKDGGYILAGSSWSNISGDKTQNSWGSYDYWIVKIDSIGNKQWDKDYGGIDSEDLICIEQTPDGGFILGGSSSSNISGDKTQNTWGDYDYWIVKIDSLGSKLWDRDFGGLGREEFSSLTLTNDGGYLIAGDSYSPISGDKTENNLGQEQTWVVKIDSIGNKLWEKTIFTSGHDETGLAVQTRNGCFTIANCSYGINAGYKSQVPWNNTGDYWVIKFCDTTQIPLISFSSFSNLCPGTCTDFVNLSFNANSYQWSFSGATPDTSTAINPQNICYANPGSYDVQLIATNANGSDTLLLTNYITVYPFPPPQSITQSGDTLFAIAGAGTYQWYFNGGIINGATDYFYIAQASGDYNVVATDGNGCEVEAAVFNVVAGLTPALSFGEGVHLYPNPVGDEVIIQKLEVKRETALEISIYNMIGERVLNVKPQINEDEQQIIDVGTLHSGMYWIEIKSGEKIFRSKFIKAGNR